MKNLVAGAIVAVATTSSWAMTGNELKRVCSNSDLELECMIYVHGSIKGMEFVFSLMKQARTSEKLTMPFCLPTGTDTAKQMVSVVKKQMNEHPEDLHLPAELVILNAVSASFSCPKYLDEKPTRK